MKFTATIAALVLAVAVSAAPTQEDCDQNPPPPPPPPSTTNNVCSSSQQQVCCNGILGCAVNILGNDCSGQSYCCNSGSSHGSLINLNLLNCVQL